MKRLLKVGIIGVGGIGRDQHIPGWSKVPFAEIIAAADTSEAARHDAATKVPGIRTFSDWQDLLKLGEIDIVDICTPNQTHCPIALAALSAGKHVICEKPLATTASEVRQMRDAAVKAKRLIMTAQHFRFDASSRRVKALIDGGLLGDIYYTRAQWLRRRLLPPRSTFIEKRLSGGGTAVDIGVHILDLAYWFLGAPKPVSVSAQIEVRQGLREDLSSAWGEWDRKLIDVEDFAAALIRFDNGTTLMLETSWLSFQPESETIRLQCFGSKAGLTWPDGVVVGETNKVPWTMRVEETPKNSAHHEEILQFAEAVRLGKPSPVSIEETLAVTTILEAIYRSGTERREVALEMS
ncbi:MAG TPA: Gfo/Idh/MocA family oxidoreductase [Gemmataceae bacterium]|jgi:predicted dehydrogenase|nr:Gfo/Idh/MocA family oxidoreductase [Gemmataceae bacterium]